MKLTHVIVLVLSLQCERDFVEGTDFAPIPMLIFRIITFPSAHAPPRKG